MRELLDGHDQNVLNVQFQLAVCLARSEKGTNLGIFVGQPGEEEKKTGQETKSDEDLQESSGGDEPNEDNNV